MKRRLSCIIMAIALVLCVMPVLTYAATEPGTSPEVSKAFIEDINLVFSGNGSVYDSQHIDITENFIHTYRTAYEAQQYDLILKSCYENGVSQIQTSVYFDVPALWSIPTDPYRESGYNQRCTHFVTQNGAPFNGKSWYFIVDVSGTFSYNVLDGTIRSVSNPTVSCSWADLGADFSGALTSQYASTPVIVSGGESASFYVTTKHTVSYTVPGTSFITATLGPFTHTSNYTIHS